MASSPDSVLCAVCPTLGMKQKEIKPDNRLYEVTEGPLAGLPACRQHYSPDEVSPKAVPCVVREGGACAQRRGARARS